ncbi:hypothetical protein [Brucella sp. IR073]|uniref:hypothetical protein n=1 Tax=unclassified Brucella TaxID=2632610 RepID=UPI003B980197
MTPATLQQCLEDMGWTPDILARQLGCHVSMVDAWLDGDIGIPPKAAAWINILAECHRAAESGKPVSLKGKYGPI